MSTPKPEISKPN